MERRCNIPTHQQSLVVGGKALAGVQTVLPLPSLPPLPPLPQLSFPPSTDSQRLCDCNIKSGTRLFLAQKSSSTPPPPPPPPSQSCVWGHKTQFWDQLQTYLLLHFSQTDTEKIIHKMEEVITLKMCYNFTASEGKDLHFLSMQELKHCVYDVNLDTIEALANQILQEQSHTHSA